MTEPRFEIRPLGAWDKPKTLNRRSSGVFRADWNDTVKLLLAETDALGAKLVVVQIDADATEIRRDGMLRARAQVSFPGVKVSFESKHGPLTYATDVHERRWAHDMPGWQANVRAIALGLEALRAVDRYGITRTGEQYRGFTALSAKPAGDEELTRADAVLVFGDALGIPFTPYDLRTEADIQTAFKAAAKRHHPDVGGSEQVFKLLVRARDALLRTATWRVRDREETE